MPTTALVNLSFLSLTKKGPLGLNLCAVAWAVAELTPSATTTRQLDSLYR